MEKLTIKKDYKPAPLNKKSEQAMLYRVDIIGWEKDNPLMVSESEKDVIMNSLSSGSFVEIGDNLINPTSIRFMKAVKDDKRANYTYKKIENEDGSIKVVKIENI